ncbi:hypothetical protein BGZ60DRAFT_400763 [Tricladium varicosporioides]|nr:hypothetical protein BGZ60DRAFT_400763 [Hymenoscyphus varicosporioides]
MIQVLRLCLILGLEYAIRTAYIFFPFYDLSTLQYMPCTASQVTSFEHGAYDDMLGGLSG